jgi:hypothetical protein
MSTHPHARSSAAWPAVVAMLAAAASPARAEETASGPTIGDEKGKPTTEVVDESYLARRWAASDLAQLAAAVRAYRKDHGAWPSVQSLGESLATYISPVPRSDPWSTPYRLDLASGEPRISSAGPDRSHGTVDDITQALSGAPSLEALRTPPAPEPAPPAAVARVPTWASAVDMPAEVAGTHARLGEMAAALESFRAQRHHYPAATTATELQSSLVPEHLPAASWSSTDAWGREWRYRSTDAGTSYSLASAGSDGVFETLVPLEPGPVRDATRDLVVVDAGFVRWPLGAPTEMGSVHVWSGGAPAQELVPRRRELAVEPGKVEATRNRLRQIGDLVEAQRKASGAYPESDDATRLLTELGSSLPATDAWGNGIAYLTLAGGSRYALASPGADGRLEHDVEEYLRGARPGTGGGADIVLVTGKLLGD